MQYRSSYCYEVTVHIKHPYGKNVIFKNFGIVVDARYAILNISETADWLEFSQESLKFTETVKINKYIK